MMKKIIDGMAYGVSLGMLVYLVQLLVFQVPSQTSSQILVVVISSALMGLSSLIYHKENWSLLAQCTLHFMSILAIVIIMGYLNGWVIFKLSFYANFMLQFVVIYVIIWLIMYYTQSKKIKQINAHLAKKD